MSNFFYVQAPTADDMEKACDLILQYGKVVNFEPLSEKDIVVSQVGEDYDNFRLCEMAFQMNFRQKRGLVCPMCETKGKTTCGHLTFTTVI